MQGTGLAFASSGVTFPYFYFFLGDGCQEGQAGWALGTQRTCGLDECHRTTDEEKREGRRWENYFASNSVVQHTGRVTERSWLERALPCAAGLHSSADDIPGRAPVHIDLVMKTVRDVSGATCN